uniref:Uncharacterized protein n=1 Tax=Glossina brevipalpis TaxID=37001 RepID=A0A1A9W477_9MUSC
MLRLKKASTAEKELKIFLILCNEKFTKLLFPEPLLMLLFFFERVPSIWILYPVSFGVLVVYCGLLPRVWSFNKHLSSWKRGFDLRTSPPLFFGLNMVIAVAASCCRFANK